MHKLNKSLGKKLATPKRKSETRHKSKAPFSREQAHAATKGGKLAPAASGKIARIISMLQSPKGASIADLSKAIGWQTHSVRGALSGAIGKKLKVRITSEKVSGVRIYRTAN